MDLDSDPYDDIFGESVVKNTTRTGSKFQPKGKRGPTKKGLTVHSSRSLQPIVTGDSVKNEDNVALQTKNPSEPYDERCSVTPLEHVANKESVDHTVSSLPESDVPLTKLNSSFEKSVGENAGNYIGLDSFEDFLPHSTTAKESSIPPEKPAIPNQNEDVLASVIAHVTDSECITNVADAPTCPEISPAQDPLTRGQPIVSIDEGDCHLYDGRLGTEQIESYPSLECLDISHSSITSGARKGKFTPKPKIQIRKVITEASRAKSNTREAIMCQMNEHLDHSERNSVIAGSVSAFHSDDVLDVDQSTTEPISGVPADEQPMYHTEASQEEIATREETVSEMLAKIATRRGKVGKSRNLSVQNVSGQDNEAGKLLRPRQKRRKRTNGRELVDEEPDVEISADCPGGSDMNEDNDWDLQVERDPQAKKPRRKSKKPVGEKKKPVKKSDEAQDQAIAAAPKKFSHRTRQRRRTVDKVLLETPEDEIDFQRVPLRDLIVLADYKERMAKKGGATLEANLNTESGGTTSTDCYKDDGFAFDQGEEDDDELAGPRIQEDSSYTNYQTYMNKTPNKRWSKQDTELFYEAMQQFGTDLSMIQQLFPGRTRKQVKLKYKKEERQHPLRLREALTSRANGHSHFETVIKRLQQIAAENKLNNEDDTISLVDEEEEQQIPDLNEEAATSKQAEVEGSDQDISAQSPLEINESEEEEIFDWTDYKSDV